MCSAGQSAGPMQPTTSDSGRMGEGRYHAQALCVALTGLYGLHHLLWSDLHLHTGHMDTHTQT